MSGATNSHAIVTRGLTKYYGGRPVVHALDLRVPTGCVYGFLGRNGAGKSTMIKMLTGMVQADFGEASVLGDDAADLSPETRQRIAYIAEGHPLYTSMTINQIERFMLDFYPTWNADLFAQIIDHFGLSRKHRIRKLSMGERAGVSLALAVAPDPELLILDDPTIGLDTVVRREFLESMIQIIQRPGRTVLFSSHLLGDVERVADRIGIIVDGVLRVDCPTDHFKASIRKLDLTFDATPRPFPKMPGVISDVVKGHHVELVIANYSDEHRSAAESLDPVSIEVVEMNLEDAFVEYTRGERRALPIFMDKRLPDAVAT
jgi:ABC-2 type transport system ATP-binding protein